MDRVHHREEGWITIGLRKSGSSDLARAGGRAKTGDVCGKHGISSATFYEWKAKYGGPEVSDVRRLIALEDENAKLKKLLAEAMLDNTILKDIASKKNGDARPQAGSRRSPAERIRGERAAAHSPWSGRSSVRYRRRPANDDAIRVRLRALAHREMR
jgi:putative transposase